MTTQQATLTVYRELILNEPLRSVEFLVETMGFESIPTDQGTIIQDRLGNYFKPLSAPSAHHRELIWIYTDDCLSDYFRLKKSGIHFFSDPHYTPRGLAAGFNDSWGNQYKILEERFYEEDQ